MMLSIDFGDGDLVLALALCLGTVALLSLALWATKEEPTRLPPTW